MLDVRLSIVWNGDRMFDDVYGFNGKVFLSVCLFTLNIFVSRA